MMRIASLTYDEARECMGRGVRDEKQISTYILSFQIADKLMRLYQSKWEIRAGEIVLHLEGLNHPLVIDSQSGSIHYGSLTTRFLHRYSPEKGVSGLVEEICTDLNIPAGESTNRMDFLFKVFVKLVEIFHARCDLQILPGKREGEWQIKLSEEGPSSWISEDHIVENRFGEKIDISIWENLRPEKVATYIFGFNRFCKNFQCPMK